MLVLGCRKGGIPVWTLSPYLGWLDIWLDMPWPGKSLQAVLLHNRLLQVQTQTLILYMLNGWCQRQQRGWMNSMNTTHWCFPSHQLPRAAPPLLSVMATHSYTCIHKSLLYFAASVTGLLMYCMVHSNSLGDWASCPSPLACSSGVPSLPVYFSQEFCGVYGHSNSKKE